MDPQTFQGFHSRTSRTLWAYLRARHGDPSAVDDLLQESYYRLLRTPVTFDGEEHRRCYLFRIATEPAARSVAAPSARSGRIAGGGAARAGCRRRSR